MSQFILSSLPNYPISHYAGSCGSINERAQTSPKKMSGRWANNPENKGFFYYINVLVQILGVMHICFQELLSKADTGGLNVGIPWPWDVGEYYFQGDGMGRSQELKFRKMLLTEGVLSVVDFSTGTNSLHLTRTQTRPFHLLSFYLLFSIIRPLFFLCYSAIGLVGSAFCSLSLLTRPLTNI